MEVSKWDIKDNGFMNGKDYSWVKKFFKWCKKNWVEIFIFLFPWIIVSLVDFRFQIFTLFNQRFNFVVDRDTLVNFLSFFYAIFGLYLGYVQIRLSTETKNLHSMEDIVRELSEKVGDAKKEVIVLSATPAIGVTGARSIYPDLEHSFKKVLENPNISVRIVCYSEENIEEFYKELKVHYGNYEKHRTEDLIQDALDQQSSKNNVEIHKVDYQKLPFLHYVLVDNGLDSGCAILWYLTKVKQSGEKKEEPCSKISDCNEVDGVGFSTKNKIFNKTLMDWFNKYWEESEVYKYNMNESEKIK